MSAVNSPDDKHKLADKTPSRVEVWKMFDRIAFRYDLLNHLLSANFDKRWRKKMISKLPSGDNLTALDLACGTGDQLLTLAQCDRVSSGIGIDMAEKMLDIGNQKISALNLDKKLKLQTGDAQKIAFDENSFDVVSISFGIRNMTDVNLALSEMYRVLKPGGRVLILEFSLPGNFIIRTVYLFYFRYILPMLGKLISGDNAAYRYLNETVETFPYGKNFCNLMENAGFKKVETTPLTTGIATIYQGDK